MAGDNPSDNDEDELSLTFAALADPTRRAILARLAQGEATVNELAEPFDLKLPTVSKHLKVLQKAGLVSQGRKAQWRPCRLEGARLKDVSDWVAQYRHAWEERFGQLDSYLQDLQKGQTQDRPQDDQRRDLPRDPPQGPPQDGPDDQQERGVT